MARNRGRRGGGGQRPVRSDASRGAPQPTPKTEASPEMSAAEDKRPDQPGPDKEPSAGRTSPAEARPSTGQEAEDPGKAAPLGGAAPASTPAAPTSPAGATASPAAPAAPSGPRDERKEAAPTPKTEPPAASRPAPASGAAPKAAASGPASSGRPATATPASGGRGPSGGSGSRPSGSGSGRPPGGDGPRAPVAPPARSGGGLIGGLVGGLLGGAAVWVVLSYLVPPVWQTDLDLLRIRVDEIGEAVTGQASTTDQLAELAERLDTLAVGPDAGLIDRVDSLEAQIAALDALGERLTAVEAGSGEGGGLPAEVEERLAALEEIGRGQSALDQRLAELETGTADSSDGGAEALQQLEERLAALESDLAGLAAGGSEGDGAEISATMTSLREQVDAMQSEFASLQNAASADDLAALDQRLAATEQAGAGLAALEQRIQSVAAEVDELSGAFVDFGRQTTATGQEVADQLAALDEDTGALGELVSNLQQQINAVQQQVGAVQQQVGSVDQRVARTEDRIESDADRRERAATLALAVGQLDSAIRQSQGYDKTLKTIQALASDDEVVADAAAALEPMAAEGPPARDTLRQEFDAVASDIANSTSQSDRMIDRAWSNISSLVSVRPVGAEVEGEGPDARVARAEARLAEGDLAGAVEELQGLEGAAAEAAAPWLEKARARLAAERAVAQLQERATGLLSPPQ